MGNKTRNSLTFSSCTKISQFIRYSKLGSSNSFNFVGIDRNSGNLLCGENLNNYIEETNLIYVKPQIRGVVVDWDHEVHLWEKM